MGYSINRNKESEAKYRTFFEHLGNAAAVIEEDMTISMVNRGFEELSGYSKGELEGKLTLTDLFPEKVQARLSYYLEASRRGVTVPLDELEVLCKGGIKRYAEIAINIAPGTDMAIVSLHDITEERKAKERLKNLEERYRRLFETANERYRRLFEGANDAIFILDLKGNPVMVNERAYQLLGYSREEITSLSLIDAVFQRNGEDKLKELLRGKVIPPYEKVFRAKGGREVPVEISVSLLKDNAGNPLFIQSIVRDITERRRSEGVLRRRAEELAALNTIAVAVSKSLELNEILDVALDKVLEIAGLDHGAIVLIDEKARKISVEACREISPDSVSKIIAMENAELDSNLIRSLRKGFLIKDTGTDARIPQGQGRTLQEEGIGSFFAVPLVSKEQLLGVMSVGKRASYSFSSEEQSFLAAIANQISVAITNAKLYAAVSKHRRNLRKLTDRLVKAQEEEKKRVSRELHDEIGAALTLVKLNLTRLESSLPARSSKIDEQVREIKSIVDQLIDDTHDLSLELRPDVLDDLGLIPALRWYIDTLKDKAVDMELKVTALEERLPPDIETTIYRVIQEALTNVVKHSEADKVEIELKRSDEGLKVVIRDNGKGFNVRQVLESPSEGKGIGLIGMRERIELIGGTLWIESSPGNGTCVEIMKSTKCLGRKSTEEGDK